METKLTIIQDFDQYFENWVKEWILPELTIQIDEIQIEAMPFMSFGCQVHQLEGRKIKLQFYSGLRYGSGMLGPLDVVNFINQMKFE